MLYLTIFFCTIPTPQGSLVLILVICDSRDVCYLKNSKNWDTLNYYRDCPTNVIVGFYSAILRSKDADRITNRVDTDQTEEQSDLGLHCLLRPICPNISNYYSNVTCNLTAVLERMQVISIHEIFCDSRVVYYKCHNLVLFRPMAICRENAICKYS